MPELIEQVNQEPTVFGGVLTTRGAVVVSMQRTGGFWAQCIDCSAYGSTTVGEIRELGQLAASQVMSWVRPLGVLLLGAWLIGCGSPEPEAPSPLPGSPPTEASDADPAPSRTAGASFQLAGPLVFRRDGGIFGFHDRVEVLPSGEVVASEDDIGVAHQLTPDELKILADVLVRAEASRSIPAFGADRISYSINYDGRTIQWADGAIPPELEPALAILRELLP